MKKPTMRQIIEYLKEQYFIEEGEWEELLDDVNHYWGNE